MDTARSGHHGQGPSGPGRGGRASRRHRKPSAATDAGARGGEGPRTGHSKGIYTEARTPQADGAGSEVPAGTRRGAVATARCSANREEREGGQTPLPEAVIGHEHVRSVSGRPHSSLSHKHGGRSGKRARGDPPACAYHREHGTTGRGQARTQAKKRRTPDCAPGGGLGGTPSSCGSLRTHFTLHACPHASNAPERTTRAGASLPSHW